MRLDDEVQLTHLGDQLVARTAHIFGAGSPQEDRMRAAVDGALRAAQRRDRAAADAALADVMRLADEFGLDVELEDLLGEESPP
jgi:hypothetical protein